MPRIWRTPPPASSSGGGITEAEAEAIIARSEKIGTTQLVKESVTTAKIKLLAVTEALLASEAVGTGKIAAGAVTAAKLAGEAVETAKIKLLAVTTGTLAEEAVTAIKIATGAVTATKLGGESVEEAKIKANAVSNAKLSTGVQEELEPKITEHSFAVAGEVTNATYPGFFVKLGTHEEKNLIGVQYELLEGTSAELELQKANEGKAEAAAGIAAYKVTELKAEKSSKTKASSKALQNEDRITLKVTSATGTPKGLICTLFLESVK